MSSEDKTNSTASLQEKLGKKKELTDAELLEHPSYQDLQKKLTDAENKANENWERVLRMQAESDNLLRRVERDVANAHKYALEKFVLELLPVIDSLERAASTHADEPDFEGVMLTLKMFYTALEKFGIQQVNPEGQAFNPEQHQAVSTVVDEKVKPGTVLQVLQRGYLLNNRLMRPALVVVAKA